MTTAESPDRAKTAPPFPERPRLVLRAGFAGRKELDANEQRHLADALHEVYMTMGHELAAIIPGIPVGAGNEPRVAAFYAGRSPLLRLVTGLCEGGDFAAWQALEPISVAPDEGTPCEPGTVCLETELAAVLPFDINTYRESRPSGERAEFDRQLSQCAWVLELDGMYDQPSAESLSAITDATERQHVESLARNRRSRGYRAQAAFLLRHSDLLIAAANPDGAVDAKSLKDAPADDKNAGKPGGKAGGTLETVREALVFELPVVFIHTGTGAVHLIAPEDDMHAVLAEPAKSKAEWQANLRDWVRQLTVDPDSGVEGVDHGKHLEQRSEIRRREALLAEYFDERESPAKAAATWRKRIRKGLWTWFEKRFRVGVAPKSDPSLAPFRGFRSRASDLSAHYSGLYRGAFLLNYVLAIGAVALAAGSLVLLATAGHAPLEEAAIATIQRADSALVEQVVSAEPRHWLYPLLLVLAFLKLIMVASINRNTRHANNQKWNDRAVDFRYLAERLRGMYYLPQAGSEQPPAAGPPQFVARVVRQSAIDWLFEAIVRSVSPAQFKQARSETIPALDGRGEMTVNNVIALEPLEVAKKLRDGWIREQAIYHDRNARTMHSMDHAIEVVSVTLSISVIVIVAIDLLLVLAEWQHWLPHEWVPTVKLAAPMLIFLTALLPAIVAALGGVRFQTECQRLAERSGVMHVMLAGRTEHPSGETHHHGGLGGYFRNVSLVLRQLLGRAPVPPPITFHGGRWALVNALVGRIEAAHATPSANIGSWSHEVLRVTERVAEDFVQEAAEWSVLYAKEVSDPG